MDVLKFAIEFNMAVAHNSGEILVCQNKGQFSTKFWLRQQKICSRASYLPL